MGNATVELYTAATDDKNGNSYCAVFALNSSLHSYLILALGKAERITMDVGFYYMANAVGRLLGTLLSGLSYQFGGLALCHAT